MPTVMIPAAAREDVETLWAYHDLRHEPRPVDVCIGLGGHDSVVPDYTAELYHQGLFSWIVFSGANAATTVHAFPDGEANGYRDHAVSLGVPEAAILIEPRATNTGENLELSRKVLADAGIVPRSIILVTRPYQSRRAYATAAKLWPEVDVVCVSRRLGLDDYVHHIGDADRVINMIVGETQRLSVYADRGFIAESQALPDGVRVAYERLVAAGYTRRLVPDTRDPVTA
ncbi:YdcF family protein [Antribacter sp. KLBMP9083]|uniref:YdcF family protein n=1 Tax=Antribacter soli TaxID=2910976 RepID=A0AA41UAM8_9MICO|nr:YdcF family protein [Antribacter soli]MCF4122852.1 YdcF family protein [Antribacter soli]